MMYVDNYKAEVFYKCIECGDALIDYGKLRTEFVVIKTMSGLKTVCMDCDSQEVTEKFKRIRCEATNKDGTQCKQIGNNVEPHRCPTHGGGKANE